MSRHITRCIIAGFVALLPIAGLVGGVLYAEYLISESWLARKDFYFPGLGLITVVALLYVVGFAVTSLMGKWLWARVDRLLDGLPGVGQLYQTLKQILGYGEGKDAMFQRVVLVRGREPSTQEFGLVTESLVNASGNSVLTVFVPGAPNPTAGRLILVPETEVISTDVSVNDVLRALVSLGKTPLHFNRAETPKR